MIQIKNNKDMVKIILVWSFVILLNQFIFYMLINNPLRNPESIFFSIFAIAITMIILTLLLGVALTYIVLL